jgi:hypothetical protein
MVPREIICQDIGLPVGYQTTRLFSVKCIKERGMTLRTAAVEKAKRTGRRKIKSRREGNGEG